jgi:hypothetical protein
VELLEGRLVPSATLVKDINLITDGSNPTSLVASNGSLFFTANDGIRDLNCRRVTAAPPELPWSGPARRGRGHRTT